MRASNIRFIALLTFALGACESTSPGMSSGSTTDDTTGGSVDDSSTSSTPGLTSSTSSDPGTTNPSGTSSPPPEGTGCCEAHEGSGCDEALVQTCVCDIDAACCGFGWTESCADIAQTRCEATCEPDMTTTDSDSTGGRTSDTPRTTGDDSTGSGDTEFGETEFGTTGDFGNQLCCAEGTGCAHTATEQCVCELDSSCCEGDEWGETCVALATESCNACTSDDCCTPQNDGGCSDTTVQDCVCALDDYCCEAEWDYICADLATSDCEARCGS